MQDLENTEHTDYCGGCDKEFFISALNESHSGFFCEDCYENICIECGEQMSEDNSSDFCSKQCYKDYMSDLLEDEYKERE